MPEVFSAQHPTHKKPVEHISPPPPLVPDPIPPVETPDAPEVTETQARKHRHVDDYSEVMRGIKPANNPFLPFLAKPHKTFFDTQVSGEQIVLILRQHPISLWQKIAAIGIAVFLPGLLGTGFLTSFLPGSYIFAITLAWYMLVFSFALETFLIWFFSVFIITDERIIDVDFVSMLYKDVSSAKIDAIQDISSKTGGLLASMVNFGTVHIQTAGEQREIQFENVPQPAKVAALLNELILEEEREKAEGRVK